MKKINKFIKEIPGSDGWWNADNENNFRVCAKTMLDSGVSEPLIKSILISLYTSTASEFGA